MSEEIGNVPSTEAWEVSWESNQQKLLELTLSAIPAQRLAWLEEAMLLVSRSDALKPRT